MDRDMSSLSGRCTFYRNDISMSNNQIITSFERKITSSNAITHFFVAKICNGEILYYITRLAFEE